MAIADDQDIAINMRITQLEERVHRLEDPTSRDDAGNVRSRQKFRDLLTKLTKMEAETDDFTMQENIREAMIMAQACQTIHEAWQRAYDNQKRENGALRRKIRLLKG